jgi:hypothetical protein
MWSWLCAIVLCGRALITRLVRYVAAIIMHPSNATTNIVSPPSGIASAVQPCGVSCINELVEVDWIRHGERIDHVVKGWQGTAMLSRTDPPLSPGGLLQAVETGLAYRKERLRLGESSTTRTFRIRSSPFVRCLQTATIIAVVGFDGFVVVGVDDALGDWRGTKLYPSGPPELLWKRQSLGPSPAMVKLLRGTIDDAISALEKCQPLLRRHNIKPKSIARWRSCNEETLVVSDCTFDGSSCSYPESFNEFRDRCSRLLANDRQRSVLFNPKRTLCTDDPSLWELRITHADVVERVLAEGLPRAGHKFTGGLSVPYCSITAMVPSSFSTAASATSPGLWGLKPLSEVGGADHLRTSGVAVSFR